jgi:hypothetical protein
MNNKKTGLADPLVAEVRQTKERLAAKFNYDVRAMLKDAQRRQRRGGKKVVALTVAVGRNEVKE